MNNPSIQYLPIGLMFIVALGFVGTTMLLTHWLGPHRKTKIKLESFECGIETQGNARLPFSIKYFLVAILFVLFDVEVIFMSQKGSKNLGDESIINTLIGMQAGGVKRGGYPCVAKVINGELVSESLNTEFYRTIMRNADAEPLRDRIEAFYRSNSNV